MNRELQSTTRPARRFVCLLALWVIGGLAFGFLSIKVSTWFLIGFLAIFAFVGVSAILLRCPNCKNQVLLYPLWANGPKIWMFWIPARCSQCGHDLE